MWLFLTPYSRVTSFGAWLINQELIGIGSSNLVARLVTWCAMHIMHMICRPRFPIRVQNFGDLATFSVDFSILYAECTPFFYFRFVWPTDLESISHAVTPTSIIPTKFELDMTIPCRVIAFLSDDMARDPVTLTFDLLSLKSCTAWRVTWPTLPPFLSYES